MLVKLEGGMGKITGSILCPPQSKVKTDRKFSFWEQSQRNDIAEVDCGVFSVTVGMAIKIQEASPSLTLCEALSFILPLRILRLIGKEVRESHTDAAGMIL